MAYEDYVVLERCPICGQRAHKDKSCDDVMPPPRVWQMVEEALPHISPPEVWPEGRKDDGGKPRYDLLPPELLDGVARVLTFGAGKYGERNWEKGMAWGRPFAALMRHMWAWWRGQGRDPETGMSHLWHAACCLAFLIAYEERREGTDDRPEKKVPEPDQGT